MQAIYSFVGTIAELAEDIIPAIERQTEDLPLWPETYQPYSSIFDRI